MAVHLRGELSRPLTPHQLAMLALVRDGCTNAEIAERMSITSDTVKTTMTTIYLKLGAFDRTLAVVTAIRRGLLPLE